jgi:hypothetical protein
MKSSVVGNATSKAEVTNISAHGIWLLFENKEYFLPFTEYPWFREANISEIQNIQVLHRSHFYWPALDVDLNKYILDSLESYPLSWK